MFAAAMEMEVELSPDPSMQLQAPEHWTHLLKDDDYSTVHKALVDLIGRIDRLRETANAQGLTCSEAKELADAKREKRRLVKWLDDHQSPQAYYA